MRGLQAITVAALGVALLQSGVSAAHGVEKPGAVKMVYVKGAESMAIKSMETPGVEAFLQDVVGSDDPKAPIACALFRLEKSAPLTYEYTYDEAKVVLDGVLTVSDGASTVDARKGDVLFFPKGSNITFTTPSSGLAFVCGQRELSAP